MVTRSMMSPFATAPLFAMTSCPGTVMSTQARSSNGSRLVISCDNEPTEDGRLGSESSCLIGTVEGDELPLASSPTACKNWAHPAPSPTPWLPVTPTVNPPQENSVTCISIKGSPGPQRMPG
nr:unnamed protein product [Digitaria exilis]